MEDLTEIIDEFWTVDSYLKENMHMCINIQMEENDKVNGEVQFSRCHV